MEDIQWLTEMITEVRGTELEVHFPELFLLQLNCHLHERILPTLWQSLFSHSSDLESQLDTFFGVCQRLLTWMGRLVDSSVDPTRWPANVGTMASDLVVKTVFHVDVCRQLRPVLLTYLRRVLAKAEQEEDQGEPLRTTPIEDEAVALLQTPQLDMMSLFAEVYLAFAETELRDRMDRLCMDNFSTEFVDDLLGYQHRVLVSRWLPRIFPAQKGVTGGGGGSSCTHIASLAAGRVASEELVYRLYYQCRRPQLFNIIIDFPDSEPAILDLRKCLNRTSIRTDLVDTLKGEVTRRLLHIGVNTNEVLSAYICAVRALRLLDPSFVAQELVCKPISVYLRNREDAMRSIIDKVIADDGTCDLENELTIPKPVDIDEDSDDEAADDEEAAENWRDWTPDPVEAIYHAGLGRRHTDLLSMMAGIYGSQDVFLTDYRSLLAQRLLRKISFETDREVRNLEMLKLRFGDQDLHECEVMLRDIQDSKRINNLITESWTTTATNDQSMREDDSRGEGGSGRGPADFPLSAYILSAQFWPAFKDESLKLPPNLMACFDKYTKSFENLKGNRSLRWLHQLGLVTMEIDLAGTKMEVQVSPVQAVILDHFTRRRIWQLKDLAQKMEVPISQLRRMMGLWIQRGLIQECLSASGGPGGDTYQLAETVPTAHAGQDSLAASMLFTADEEEPGGSGLPSARGQREEELQIFWTYIVGMLTNLCSLNLDRIHTMLRMFAMSGSRMVECSRDQLKTFLDKKVREKVLVCTDDIYTLAKPEPAS